MAHSPFLERVRRAIRARHLSLRTERAYVQWIEVVSAKRPKRVPVVFSQQEVRAVLAPMQGGAQPELLLRT